ncbi:hypothetical protein [Chishuiella sp.]|uniref:hypothetical protein n=1 Tax=Chishuiella sp. TaxID=1969467 RepID=UPI0028AE3F16|nr:hypothetical protein [Chishuiella sp.]
MEIKTTLKEIDGENWKFTLYESQDSNWYVDVVYSPRSFVDLSMLIKLNEEEKNTAINNRDNLIKLCDKIRDNYEHYQSKSINRDNFQFDWKMKRIKIIEITNEFIRNYKIFKKKSLLSESEWKINALLRDLEKTEKSKEIELSMEEKIDWLIKNDKNPIILYANELLSEPISNEKMNNIISSMTNGKLLDSIGFPFSHNSPINNIISNYIDKISCVKNKYCR